MTRLQEIQQQVRALSANARRQPDFTCASSASRGPTVRSYNPLRAASHSIDSGHAITGDRRLRGTGLAIHDFNTPFLNAR
jgi:hypothetical protein